MIKSISNLILITVVSMLLSSCDGLGEILCPSCPEYVSTDNSVNPDINESMELELSCSNCTTDAEGNLYYEYKGYNYGQIDFYISNVENHTLVGWDSPEQYCVMHWETEICEPVIDGQTYSDENGYGHQNFYMNETFKGQTLNLIGFINHDIIDELTITIY